VKRGDQAAATGDWKAAVEDYGTALREEPGSRPLQEKYQHAREQAIAQSLATANRCNTEQDMACVDHETSYVLQLDPGNAEAPPLRQMARKGLAATVARARESAGRGDYLLAVRTLKEARGFTGDPETVAAIAGAAQEMAGAVGLFVRTTLQQPSTDADRAIATYSECIEMLTEVGQYLPDGPALLAEAKAGLDRAGVQQDAARRAAEAAQLEDARRQQAAQAAPRQTVTGA
jgi:hypothetical protein